MNGKSEPCYQSMRKNETHVFEIYRPVTLLNFSSKVLEKCMTLEKCMMLEKLTMPISKTS